MTTSKAHGDPARRKFPAQGLVRILRGSYPNLRPARRTGRALDIGCGDGGNTEFLQAVGFQTTGIEVDAKSVAALRKLGQASYLRARANSLPFLDSHFDFVVAWHSIYYLDQADDSMRVHIAEIRRVLKQQGTVVLAIPKETNFIFEDSTKVGVSNDELAGVGRRRINRDPFGVRGGQLMATVTDLDAFRASLLREYFREIQVGEETGNWFGLQYDWWILVCYSN